MNKHFIKNSVVVLAAVISIVLVILDKGYNHSVIIFIVIIAALLIMLINWKSVKQIASRKTSDKNKKSKWRPY